MARPSPCRSRPPAGCRSPRRGGAGSPGPGLARDSIRPIAHRWRSSASRTEIARRRIAVFQSAPATGRSISAKTRSTMPSRTSLLVGEVVVERHRLDAELLAELAHAQGLEPALIGELQGGLEDPLAGQGFAALRSASWSRVVIGLLPPDLRSGVDSLVLYTVQSRCCHFTPYSPEETDRCRQSFRTTYGSAAVLHITRDRQAGDRRARGAAPRPRGGRQPGRLGDHERPAVHRPPGLRPAQAEEQHPWDGRRGHRRGRRLRRDALPASATRSSAGATARTPSTRPRPRTQLALKPANLTFEAGGRRADGRPRRPPGPARPRQGHGRARRS